MPLAPTTPLHSLNSSRGLKLKKRILFRASSVLIFEGEIVGIQPTGTGLCESLKGREDDIKIDPALFGETVKGRIAASCGSVNCPIPLSLRLHAKVIVYGALQLTGKSVVSSASGCND